MAEINLAGIFKDAKWWVGVGAVVLGIGYLYQEPISKFIAPDDTLVIAETAAQYTDDDILSVGYWKLNEDETLWECVESVSIHGLDFCSQTGSFANDNFVKGFQVRLENQDVIIVTVEPNDDPNSSFQRYWLGTYKATFGLDQDEWGDPLYVIYFQVGDTDDMRRVLYTLDKGDAREGRTFTTYFEQLILDTLN